MLLMQPPYFDGMNQKQSTQFCCDSINNGAKISIEIKFKDADDNNILVHDNDLLMGNAFVSNSIINPDVDLGYGYVNSEETRIKLIKNSNTEQIDWLKKIEVYFDIQTSAGVGRVLFGEYYGDTPNKITQNGTDIYEYVGYDVISTLDTPADDFLANTTFPIYINTLLLNMGGYLGVTISKKGDIFPTIVEIPENIFYDGCTFREILHWIAEVNGSSVISRGKNIYLQYFGFRANDIIYTITPNQYYSINKNEYKVPQIPAVMYESTTDPSKNTAYPSTYTGVPYTITDNPIFESADAQLRADNIYTLYEDRMRYRNDSRPQYTATSVNAIGNPFVQVGDIIFVEDLQGVTDPLWVFTHTFSYGAGTRSHFECTGSTSRQRKTYRSMDPYQVNNIIGKRIADNLTTSTKGLTLDASQGKVLNDQIASFGSLPLAINKGGTGMTALSSTTVSGNGVTANCYKWGKVVMVYMTGNVSAAVSSGGTLLTLPSGYRPKDAVYFIAANPNFTITNSKHFSITTGGKVVPQVALPTGAFKGYAVFLIP